MTSVTDKIYSLYSEKPNRLSVGAEIVSNGIHAATETVCNLVTNLHMFEVYTNLHVRDL